ncbi:MAG: hypothetical protein KDM63_03290 [Verrucomicrobiae bacterium]|nr:hypothetical protein [Verrucomicrobiae bacterium]
MPKATVEQQSQNLTRLLAGLQGHCPSDAGAKADAERLATRLPLAHSLAFGKLADSLRDGELRSQQLLGRPAGRAESAMETTDDVFLYVGAFTYPDTECGFLFVPSLEGDHQAEGVATPFDSGALAFKVDPPEGCPDGVSCVRDHELPLVGHRRVLARVMTGYLPSPSSYLLHSFDLHGPKKYACHCGHPMPHPFGLRGGDDRVSTFEVRIPQRVALQAPHLRAVFVREGLEIPELSELFAIGIPIVRFPSEDGADFFHALRESCISFIAEHLVA